MRIGIDIGSTTVKTVILSEDGELLFHTYERHFSKVREKAAEQLRVALSDEAIQKLLIPNPSFLTAQPAAAIAITGSAGLGVAKATGLPFVQEVYATAAVVRAYEPDTDAVIELGGEDAKIIFFGGDLEERMNGSCAGGTGAFIDQMATLLDVTVQELDELSLKHEKIHPIASRCGVFAKSDIQPILNQGGRREDIAASIFQAVVDQTVGGLTQGRELTGKIMFLGGPLTFLKGLRERFVLTLALDEKSAVFPENAECFAAIGAAVCADKNAPIPFNEILRKLESAVDNTTEGETLPPLFTSQEEYDDFLQRHSQAAPKGTEPGTYSGGALLGVDAGSTTTKLVLITPEGEILYSFYGSNKGNPVSIILRELNEIYDKFGKRVKILGSAVTGYGEELIKNAFNLDLGLVETMAHLRAAQHFDPNVDFIIDIGGQDVKCFKIRNGTVDGIMLNEACSSGCGSFIETFAIALGYDIADFAKLGLFAQAPADLGSRCTVFMNSSVKQAQKNGASVEAISAGLSISVVKNAVYKVIRAVNAEQLGQNIVVQGGTFLNDAVLRAFEQELNIQVTRPEIPELMGAYGAALSALDNHRAAAFRHSGIDPHSEFAELPEISANVMLNTQLSVLNFPGSTILSKEALQDFTHEVKPVICRACSNKCGMTINTFDSGRRFISGNRCSRPLGKGEHTEPNLIKYKYRKLRELQGMGKGTGRRGLIGMPFGLINFELLPFWFEFLTKLNFSVLLPEESTRKLYTKGQRTIPSDTVCYPAKLMHGHIESLLDKGAGTIFFPCMPYNLDEGLSDNHFNCPVVAYYPELLAANMPRLKDIRFLTPYFGLFNKRGFKIKSAEFFEKEFGVPPKETKAAAEAAYKAHSRFLADVEKQAARYIEYAAQTDKNIIVIAGRPYHADPEINHGIDELITSLGLVLITEDSIARRLPKQPRKILNQWTYHARMYNAAHVVLEHENMQLVQLVSFGCGTDAVTTDELRDILETGGKIYTQIKIDDISNLGAAKIRIRSLIAAMQGGHFGKTDIR